MKLIPVARMCCGTGVSDGFLDGYGLDHGVSFTVALLGNSSHTLNSVIV